MNLQYRLSNGQWVDCGERAEEFLGDVIAFHADHPNLKPLSREEAELKLTAGEVLISGPDWHSRVRMAPIPQPAPAPPETVLADCGHRVPRASLMGASLGSCYPDCYDRMSA